MTNLISNRISDVLDPQLRAETGRKLVHSLIDYLAQNNHTHHSLSSLDVMDRPTDDDRIILIQFPSHQDVLVDLTFSLDAFHVYCQWPQGTSLNHSALKDHIHSIRRHIVESDAKYKPGFSQDRSIYVQLSLVPSDEALMIALDNDQGLFFEAFDKGIILSSPATFSFVFRQVKQFMGIRNKPQAQWRIRRELAIYLSDFVYFMKNY